MMRSTSTVGATGTMGGGAEAELLAAESICAGAVAVSTFDTVGGSVLLGGLAESTVAGADTGTCVVAGRLIGAPLRYIPAGMGGTPTIWTASGPTAGLYFRESEECELTTGRIGYGEASTGLLCGWRRNSQMRRQMTRSKPATPPMTPPAMAPVFVDLVA